MVNWCYPANRNCMNYEVMVSQQLCREIKHTTWLTGANIRLEILYYENVNYI